MICGSVLVLFAENRKLVCECQHQTCTVCLCLPQDGTETSPQTVVPAQGAAAVPGGQAKVREAQCEAGGSHRC